MKKRILITENSDVFRKAQKVFQKREKENSISFCYAAKEKPCGNFLVYFWNSRETRERFVSRNPSVQKITSSSDLVKQIYDFAKIANKPVSIYLQECIRDGISCIPVERFRYTRNRKTVVSFNVLSPATKIKGRLYIGVKRVNGTLTMRFFTHWKEVNKAKHAFLSWRQKNAWKNFKMILAIYGDILTYYETLKAGKTNGSPTSVHWRVDVPFQDIPSLFKTEIRSKISFSPIVEPLSWVVNPGALLPVPVSKPFNVGG
jgi:hypothetical protein